MRPEFPALVHCRGECRIGCGHAFFATPPGSRYSKREESFDTSILTIEGKAYAESKVCGTTKPGTR